jgi:hypothetical protein
MRQQLLEVHTSSPEGRPILVFPCALKSIRTMGTTRAIRGQRAVLYAALAAYLGKLFLRKDREHYTSKKWWRAILIEYHKLAIIVSLLLTIYSLLRTNSTYDTAIITILASIPLTYFLVLFLGGPSVFNKTYKNRPFTEPPFYLRAYFLHSAVEFAYLRCFNSLVTLDDLDAGRVNKEKRKILCKAARAPFWPVEGKKPWQLRIPKLTLRQRVKNIFYALVDMYAPLPLRWSEDDVLSDYKRLSAQDKIYLISSLRHVMYIFNASYFELPRREIFSMDTTYLTSETYSDRELRRLYGPLGKGVFSISDYFSLFPSVEHAYAAFYHVLQRTWQKMRIQDICAGYSPVMALLMLTEGSYHPEKVTI